MRTTRHLLAAGLVTGLGLLAGCGGGGGEPLAEPVALTPNPHPAGSSFTIANPKGSEPVKVEVLTAGGGASVRYGSRVNVHYVAQAVGQEPYKSTFKKGAPEFVAVGAGSVLVGFDLALQQMREGDVWRITMPPELAFGTHAGPKLPANSTVQVEATLVSIER